VTDLVLKILVRRRISLSKLRDGGAAMFAADSRNHQKVIEGNININPFDKNRLREFVASYVRLARANKPEEQSPWAIIIPRLPFQPHEVLESVPAVRRPM